LGIKNVVALCLTVVVKVAERKNVMSPKVISASRSELEERSAAILARLDTTLESLRRKAEEFSLVGDEWAALEELEEIDFLLRS
jgi:hypothetical protein